MLIYPPATALIILAFAGKLFRHDRAVYLSTMIFTWAAAIFDFFKTLPAGVRTTTAARRAGRAGETVSAAVRPEPRLAAPGCCRLCHRHGDPSFQTRPRKIIGTNRNSVKNRNLYRFFTDF
ncbi:MAG: branched-chain amino acid transport system II carrier protein [Acutalibacteraceae bacterium]